MHYLDPEVLVTQLTRVRFVVRDAGLLMSALARPRTSLFGDDAYPTLALKTAALMDSIVNNHPMIDGNKRSSWIVANLFLEMNGVELHARVDDSYRFILSIATGSGELQPIADWLEAHSVPLDDQ